MKRILLFAGIIAACFMTGCESGTDNEANNEEDKKIIIDVSDDSPYRVKDDDESGKENKKEEAEEVKIKPHTDSSDLTTEQLKGGYENLVKFKEAFENNNAEQLERLGFGEKFEETKMILEKYGTVDFGSLNEDEFEAAYQELNGVAIQFDKFRGAISEDNKENTSEK